MSIRTIINNKEFIVSLPKFEKLKQLYRENFLPDFVIETPIVYPYKKYFHVPVFFLWLICILAIGFNKISGYLYDFSNIDWLLLAFVETFWLSILTPFVITILIPIKPFRALSCYLLVFYVYMLISSLIPSIGQWFALHKYGHFYDFLIFISSILIGHFIIFRKLLCVKIEGKYHYIYTK